MTLCIFNNKLNNISLKKITAAVFAFFALLGSLTLLWLDKIKGADFVILIAIIIAVCLFIILFSQIAEITIANATIKFIQNAKNNADEIIENLEISKMDANEVIKDLKKSRITSFKILLSLIMKHDGTLSRYGEKDKRRAHFWPLYDDIKRSGLTKELSSDLLEVVKKLIKHGNFNPDKQPQNKLATPEEHRNNLDPDMQEDYKKIYNIYQELSK